MRNHFGSSELELQESPTRWGHQSLNRGADPDESPVHTVTFQRDCFMSETQVTQAQWISIMGYNAATHNPDGIPYETLYGVGNYYPVYRVSWDDVHDFLGAIEPAVGIGPFRLPSEAERESACRSATQSRFYFGDSLFPDCHNCSNCPTGWLPGRRSDYMWFCANNDTNEFPWGPKEVGLLVPNSFGLHDMHGNQRDWCADWYHDTYEGAPADGSAWLVPPTPRPSHQGRQLR